jgi:pyridoxal phosphate enzyme (YggS family)
MQLRQRLEAFEQRLQAACLNASRERAAVTVVAVTKTLPIEVARLLPEAGIVDLGESRPQELWRKAAALPASCGWHLVGHLQKNKVERTLKIDPFIHSIDSLPLLQCIETEAAKQEKNVRVLLEVNASREANKHGFAPEALGDLLPAIGNLKHVHVCGLMTMAAQEDNPDLCRPTFALVRQLAERLRPQVSPPHRFDELSMGMSSDFEAAVAEGATMIRIGTALFEGLG